MRKLSIYTEVPDQPIGLKNVLALTYYPVDGPNQGIGMTVDQSLHVANLLGIDVTAPGQPVHLYPAIPGAILNVDNPLARIVRQNLDPATSVALMQYIEANLIPQGRAGWQTLADLIPDPEV